MRKELEAQGISAKQIHQELNQYQAQEIELLLGNEKVFKWFIETDDLYRFTQGFCVGLDVTAVKDDAQLNEREFTKQEYQLLREMGKAAAAAMNEQRERST